MTRRILLGLFAGLGLSSLARADEPRAPLRVMVWDEQQPQQKAAYPNFLGNAIADYLRRQPGLDVVSARLDDPEQGLSDAALDRCDVLIWWGHVRNGEIKPEKAKAIVDRIRAGKLSLLALHSAHWSEPFVEAMRQRALDDAKATLGKDRSENLKVVTPPRFSAPGSRTR